VGIITSVRQARLKPECAERYPTLPARMWTSATCLAELVTASRGAQPAKLGKDRTLCDADFQFRGGFSRWSHQSFAGPRIGEPPFSW
jgi:hypothetical protein